MEILSGAASGMAVASLVLQLLQSTDTVKNFISQVKGASKELDRLIDLLVDLSELLDHVRTLVECQTSLQNCPLPCQPIFNALKVCESSLLPLERVVEKYQKKHATKPTGVRRLVYDIKFAFKANQAISSEERIQRAITTLNLALSLNGASVQLTMLSTLLHLQRTVPTATWPGISNVHQGSLQGCYQSSPVELEKMHVSQTQSNLLAKTRHWWVESPLRRIGIQQRRMTRSIAVSNKEHTTHTGGRAVIISGSYDAFWGLLGYGIHWSQRYTGGDVLPSLRIYPVVERFHFDEPTHGLPIWKSSIEEVQQALCSGALHPFTKDLNGYSLLHYAALSKRVDICRLLGQYGVQLDADIHGFSPLPYCLNTIEPNFNDRGRKSSNSTIDTLRVLLLQFEQVDDFETSFKHIVQPYPASLWLSLRAHVDAAEWLWREAAQVFHGTDLACLRAKLVQGLTEACIPGRSPHNDVIDDILTRLMNEEVLELYLSGGFQAYLPHRSSSSFPLTVGGEELPSLRYLLNHAETS